MPVSIHQLPIHGHESLSLTALPISYLTEQSLESTNKDLKYARTHHSRKISRIATITDMFNRQNDRSDIKVGMRLQERRRRQPKLEYPPDLLSLLKKEEVDEENEDDQGASRSD